MRELLILNEFGNPQTVALIIIAAVSFVLGMNIVLFINDKEDDTVSDILKKWSYDKFFFLSFGWGVLFGHFFLGVTQRPFPTIDHFMSNLLSDWWPVIVVVAIVGIMIGIGYFLEKQDTLRVRPFWHLILLLLGVCYGHFIWTQNLG